MTLAVSGPLDRPVQMMLKAVAVTVAAASSGLETGSAIAGIIGGFVALVTIALLLRQNNTTNRREHDAELARERAAGRAERDDEVRDLTNRVADMGRRLDERDRDIDFYRAQWALLQGRQPPRPGSHGDQHG